MEIANYQPKYRLELSCLFVSYREMTLMFGLMPGTQTTMPLASRWHLVPPPLNLACQNLFCAPHDIASAFGSRIHPEVLVRPDLSPKLPSYGPWRMTSLSPWTETGMRWVIAARLLRATRGIASLPGLLMLHTAQLKRSHAQVRVADRSTLYRSPGSRSRLRASTRSRRR